MSDVWVVKLFQAIDRQWEDPGSNPGTVRSVFNPQQGFNFKVLT